MNKHPISIIFDQEDLWKSIKRSFRTLVRIVSAPLPSPKTIISKKG
jgi:hypothetical protein